MVGVLTSRKKPGKYPLPVGKDARLKIEMTTAAREKGILMFFFYPEGVTRNKRAIVGHTYRQIGKRSGIWQKAIFPLPKIIYNRLSNRKIENQKNVKNLLNFFDRNPEVFLFNTRFLHKWEVHNSLSQNSLTANLVPETRLFNKADFYAMLGKYPELFLKPINNSIGKGIIKVRYRNQHYEFKRATSGGKWRICRTKKYLFLSLSATIDKPKNYLIQKSIDLAEVNGRIFDLRSQAQKDGDGKWVLTGVGVRIAAKNKFVTHIPNGGSRANYNEIIKKVFGESPQMQDYLNEQLMYVSQVVPCVLEESLGITLSILSIDIGIDKKGNMQIIEVNSKPASFDEDNIRQQHLEYLNEYFLYISKHQ